MNQPLDELAAEAGLVMVTKEAHDSMTAQLEQPLVEKAAAEGFELINKGELEAIKISAAQLAEEKAKNDGKIVISQESYDELVRERDLLDAKFAGVNISTGDELAIANVKDQFKTLGFTVVPNEHVKTVRTSKSFSSESDQYHDAEESFVLSEEELTNSASKLGMVVISKSEYEKLSHADEQKVRGLAAGLSLSVIAEVELLKWKQSLAAKDDEIYSLAKERDTKASEIEKLIQERDASVKALEDEQAVSDAALKLSILPIPESQYISTTAHPKPEATNVKVVPTSYFNQLLKLKAMSLEKCSDELFKQHAEKRGFIRKDEITPVIASTAQFKSSPASQQRDSFDLSNRITPPSNLIARQRQTTPGSSRNSSGGSVTRGVGPGIPQSTSVVSHLSEQSAPDSLRSNAIFSMATDVSLTDKSMIPAITQVVIGEYLFKYYRRLGPFKVISETRHERYFWVHPYSLTLYWSENNPSLANPSQVRTRAAAIIGVESVEDNNPLPTGLYYKSIIVHSTDRSIKITCATRQRHNIWYNALRYLINRNIDDLTIDEDTNAEIISQQISSDEGGLHPPPVKSESQRNLETLMDTGDRRAYPRPRRINSTPLASQPSSPTSRLSRFLSLRRL